MDLGRKGGWRLDYFGEHVRANDVEPSEEILADHSIWSLDHLCQIDYRLLDFDDIPLPEELSTCIVLYLRNPSSGTVTARGWFRQLSFENISC